MEVSEEEGVEGESSSFTSTVVVAGVVVFDGWSSPLPPPPLLPVVRSIGVFGMAKPSLSFSGDADDDGGSADDGGGAGTGAAAELSTSI